MCRQAENAEKYKKQIQPNYKSRVLVQVNGVQGGSSVGDGAMLGRKGSGREWEVLCAEGDVSNE
jgi:hypothetical protein